MCAGREVLNKVVCACVTFDVGALQVIEIAEIWGESMHWNF